MCLHESAISFIITDDKTWLMLVLIRNNIDVFFLDGATEHRVERLKSVTCLESVSIDGDNLDLGWAAIHNRPSLVACCLMILIASKNSFFAWSLVFDIHRVILSLGLQGKAGRYPALSRLLVLRLKRLSLSQLVRRDLLYNYIGFRLTWVVCMFVVANALVRVLHHHY